MRINSSPNVPTQAAYKVQSIAQPDFAVAKNLPVIIGPTAPPAPQGPSFFDMVGQALQPIAAFGSQLGQWFAGMVTPRPPELATSVPSAVITTPQPAMTSGDRRRLEGAFRELDEDGNGRLEGEELTGNSLVSFDAVSDAGLTAREFVDEVGGLDGAGALSAEAVRAASLKGRIFELMKDVWETDAYCNDTSYKWWKGQLKLAGGDFDRLKETMVAYKKSIER